MKTTKLARIETVDILRGFAMLTMVLLHTNAYFLNNPISYFTWSWGQYAVPIFIFSSSYIFFKKQYDFGKFHDVLTYVKRRFLRLLFPYYIFAIIFIFLKFLKEPSKINFDYISQNILLTGGIDINWLILLFIYFSFIMPFLSWSYNKNRIIFYAFSVVSVICSLILMFVKFPYNYRFIMWLPWSSLVVLTLIIERFEKNIKLIIAVFIASVIGYIFLSQIQSALHHSLLIYDNKYPPNLYHNMFSSASIILLFWLAKKNLFSFFPLKQILLFLSKHSYSIYFIHYLIIYFLSVHIKIRFSWVSFFFTVLFLSLFSQIILNFSGKLIYIKKFFNASPR